MFVKFQLTNKGRDLLNKVIAEKKILKFTKFELGQGQPGTDTKQLTALNNKFADFQVTQTSVLTDGITNIKGFYDNKTLETPSKLTEIGVFAQIQDEPLSEVLFSYTSQLSTEAETIPSKESYFSRTFSVMNKTDNATNITFDLTIRQDKYNFGTLAEMKSADYLEVGDKCVLWGNNSLGDSTFEMYIITAQMQSIQLNNQLYAKEYFKSKSGFNKEKTDVYNENDTDKLFTQKGANDLYKKVVSKNGDKMSGDLTIEKSDTLSAEINFKNSMSDAGVGVEESYLYIKNRKSNKVIKMSNDGSLEIQCSNLEVPVENGDLVKGINTNYKNIVLKPYQPTAPQSITKQGIFPFDNVEFNGYTRWGKTISLTRNNDDYYNNNYMWQLIFDHFGDVSYAYKINDSDGYKGYSQFAFYDKMEGIIGKKTGTFPITNGANVGEVYYYPATKEYYECCVSFSNALSVPNSNFRKLNITQSIIKTETLYEKNIDTQGRLRKNFKEFDELEIWFSSPGTIDEENRVYPIRVSVDTINKYYTKFNNYPALCVGANESTGPAQEYGEFRLIDERTFSNETEIVFVIGKKQGGKI